jgi:hypothetical protein
MRRSAGLVGILSVVLVASAVAQTKYEKPPKEVLEVLHAPQAPTPFLSPTRDTLALAQPVRYPPISDLAEPMLRLAGARINPRTNAERSYLRYWVALSLKRIADGAETPVAFPAGVRLGGTPGGLCSPSPTKPPTASSCGWWRRPAGRRAAWPGSISTRPSCPRSSGCRTRRPWW